MNMQLLKLLFTGLLTAGSTLAQTSTGFIEVDNGKLYYETAGQGNETIVFIHDGLVHSVIWDAQFEEFSKNYRVVRYDRRGYGRSPKPDTNYSNIEDLNTVFETLKIDRAVVIGMSAGGGLVIDFTIHHPEKVSALITVGAVVGGFTYSDHLMTRGGRLTPADFADRAKLLEYLLNEDPYEIAPQNKEAREKLKEIMKDYSHNIDPEKSRLLVPPDRPALERLGEIKVPTLIIIGEFDIPDVFVHAGAIESGISNAQKAIVMGAGHLVPFEQPELFNQQVKMFLYSNEFFRVLNTDGVAAAVELFNRMNSEDKDYKPFSENRMNVLGYQYLQSGKIADAIEIFKMNVRAYPEAANTYDSLGEAYMTNGDKELAIKNYKKSLELNPANTNAEKMLKQLE
jgi:pimeloyl-ACP methyl ester carboxylesterase